MKLLHLHFVQHIPRLLKPRDPKLFGKTLVTLPRHGQACASTSDRVCANVFSLAATVKFFKKGLNNVFLNHFWDLWASRDFKRITLTELNGAFFPVFFFFFLLLEKNPLLIPRVRRLLPHLFRH